jgi:hypothetical protein
MNKGMLAGLGPLATKLVFGLCVVFLGLLVASVFVVGRLI